MKINLHSQNFAIKILANKAESLGQTVGKVLAKNKFGSRTVLNVFKSPSDKPQNLKFEKKIGHSTPKTSKKEVKFTPHIAQSIKASGLS